jgi:hypothetical protein
LGELVDEDPQNLWVDDEVPVAVDGKVAIILIYKQLL